MPGSDCNSILKDIILGLYTLRLQIKTPTKVLAVDPGSFCLEAKAPLELKIT